MVTLSYEKSVLCILTNVCHDASVCGCVKTSRARGEISSRIQGEIRTTTTNVAILDMAVIENGDCVLFY